MAIDTAEKRRSAAGCGAFPLGPGVTPDAAKGAGWRQQAGWGYAGIAAADPLPAGPTPGAMTLTEKPIAWMHLWEAPLQ